MSYTPDDISAAVSQLLNTSVRYGKDVLTGNRQITTTFNDVQESAAATFVMFPAAMLHVADLSARVLVTNLTAYQTTITDLINSVQSIYRTVSNVQAAAPLANTVAALVELDGVVQNGQFSGLQSIPSYQRFSNNAAGFLSIVHPAIVSGGSVVPSKQQAMSDIPAQVAGLPGAFAPLWQQSKNFAGAVTDYQQLNLPAVLLQNVVRRAVKVLQTQYNNMSSMSLEDQQTLLYNATLNMLTVKSVLGSMESFGPPPEQYDEVSGTIYAYADPSHPAGAAASITASKAGPYYFRYGVSDQLRVTIDGNPLAVFNMTMPAITSTYLEGSVGAPYTFDLGDIARIDNTLPGDYVFATDQTLKFLVEATINGAYGSATIEFPIAAGTYTVMAMTSALAAFMLGQIGSNLFTAMTPVGAVALSIICTTIGSNYKITMLDGDANAVLGFQNGTSSTGRNRNDQLLVTYKSSAVPATISFTVTFPTGSQQIDQVVDTFNAARPSVLVGLLHAEAHRYISSTGTQTVCRLVVDDTSSDAYMLVTSTITPGQQQNSGLGIGGEITHLPITVQRTVDFINAFPPASSGPPPGAPKFSDYAVASVVTLATVQYLCITSKNKTSNNAKVLVEGTAVPILFGATQYSGLGASNWYQMSASNPVITTGDIVELHDTDVNDVTVQSVTGDGLLYMSMPLAFYKIYTLGGSSGNYALAFRGDRRSFEQVVGDAVFQQFLADDHSGFFGNLTRYTNMMLSDKNPTEDEISTVLGELSTHLDEVTYVINLLNKFHAYPCTAIDGLFKQLNEKGSDRAVSTLLQCQFAKFFGLDVNTCSYAGTISSGLRTIVQQDLPVAKFDRVKGGRSVISTSTSADYDSDFSDVAPDANKFNIDKQ